MNRWKSHPLLARLLRVAIFTAPLASSVGFTWLAGVALPPERLGLNRWVWIGLVFVLANGLLYVVTRLTRRLLPLVALMKLTLVFPDHAPSRTKATLRRSNSRTMLRKMREAQTRGDETGEALHGDYLVQLLNEVNDHDRLTRGHSERVRAYAEMLGEELGLNDDDMNKLRWAALLHDVGKLAVPSEILNKAGRPTDAEWKVLSGHPAAGLPILEPLRPWLGDWVHAADQHHCRWDGRGYPQTLAGTEISLAGRLVAIADAYDVMTSARSYKKGLSPELARQELTNCAGSQFDPHMVRAFLQIGLGRLKTVAGPFAWLANLTGSAQIPAPIASTATTTAWSAGVAAFGIAAATVTGLLPADPPPVEQLAYVATSAIEVEDVDVEGSGGQSIEILLTARSSSGPPEFTVGGPAHGSVTQIGSAGPVASSSETWQLKVTYMPNSAFTGEDGFSFQACDPAGSCDLGQVTITVVQGNRSPVARPDVASVALGEVVIIDVLANDTDPDGDELTLVRVEPVPNGSASIDAGSVVYRAGRTDEGPVRLAYVIADTKGAEAVGIVMISIASPESTLPPTTVPSTTVPSTTVPSTTVPSTTVPSTSTTIPPLNLSPVANDDFVVMLEDGSILIDVLANDTDPEGDPLSISGLGAPLWGTATVEIGQIRYVPGPNYFGSDGFVYTASDGANPDVSATVTVTVIPVNDSPVAVDDVLMVSRGGTAVTIDVRLNDSDVDGDPLSVVAVVNGANGTAVDSGNGTITYTHDNSATYSDSFTYTIADPGGLQDTATVAVTVIPPDDFDAVDADSDNCPFQFNPDQMDTDGDGIGDACDPTPTTASTSTFTDSGQALGTGRSRGVALADIDRDGDLDVIFARDNVPSTVWFNDGNGTFTPSTQTFGVRRSKAVIAADLDGDGDVDLVFGNGNGQGNTIWLNDGSGTFVDTGQSLGAGHTLSLAVGDFDGDGDLDLVFGNDDDDPNEIWVNDGNGTFALATQVPGHTDTSGVAVGDLDGDGDLDIVFANDGEDNTVWLNDGFGGFSDSGQSLGSGGAVDVALADLDGDGDLDIVFAAGNDGDHVWFNDGAGVFSDSGQTVGLDDSVAVSVGDVDGDGNVDLVFGKTNGPDSVWLNGGGGVFTDRGLRLGNEDTRDLVLGDLDGDGDLDLVTVTDGDPNLVWFNS